MAVIVALVLVPVIVTQGLTIRGYSSELGVKTEAAAACAIARAVSESESERLASSLNTLNEQLKQASLAAERQSASLQANASEEIKVAESRAIYELNDKKQAKEMTKWYESIWQ